jgi:hypothetical protein
VVVAAVGMAKAVLAGLVTAVGLVAAD